MEVLPANLESARLAEMQNWRQAVIQVFGHENPVTLEELDASRKLLEE
jgi:hypothetical protein